MRAYTAAVLALVVLAGASIHSAEAARGSVARAIDSYEKGIADQEHAVELERQLASVGDERERGRVARDIDRAYRAAAKSLRAATSQDPTMVEAHAALGQVLLQRGEAREALEALHRALALVPDDPAVMQSRGTALLQLEQLEEVKDAFAELHAADPASADRLLISMKIWVIGKRQDPGSTSAEEIASLEDWIEDLEAEAARDPEAAE